MEHLVNYSYQPPTQIRKCESSDNNELKPNGEETEDIEDIYDEDLEFHVEQEKQDNSEGLIEFSPTVFWKIEIDRENEEKILNEYD